MTETAYIIFLEYLYTEVIRDLELHLKKKNLIKEFSIFRQKAFPKAIFWPKSEMHKWIKYT